MTLHWVIEAPGSTFRWRSADGYYGITADHDADEIYEAFHIDALWARPASIGRAGTMDAAKTLCEEHQRQPAA